MKTNKILETHGDWLLLDISTPKFLTATMAVDTEFFMEYAGGRFSACSRPTSKYIYSQSWVDRNTINTHRLVLRCDQSTHVDHINHGTMAFIDNRRCNLRIASKAQNSMNTGLRNNSTSGCTGVSLVRETGSWRSHIKINGKQINLGYFDNIEIAIGARHQAEREYFGEYMHKMSE